MTYTIAASQHRPEQRDRRDGGRHVPGEPDRTWTCVGAGGGTCTASGSGNINDTVNLPARRRASPTPPACTDLAPRPPARSSNTATVDRAGGVTDPTPGNNSATDTDTLTPQRRPGDHQDRRRDDRAPGRQRSPTRSGVATPGPSNVTGATVADTLPGLPDRDLDRVGAGGGTCTASGTGNINDTVNLPVGASVTYTAQRHDLARGDRAPSSTRPP